MILRREPGVIPVAVGVLVRDGNVLISQRRIDGHHAGAWEFPGGKIDVHETPLEGLVRELHEELGVRVVRARYLLQLRHDYPERRVHLYVWTVLEYRGEPVSREGQPLRWVQPETLMDQGLLEADRPIAAALLRAGVDVGDQQIVS